MAITSTRECADRPSGVRDSYNRLAAASTIAERHHSNPLGGLAEPFTNVPDDALVLNILRRRRRRHRDGANWWPPDRRKRRAISVFIPAAIGEDGASCRPLFVRNPTAHNHPYLRLVTSGTQRAIPAIAVALPVATSRRCLTTSDATNSSRPQELSLWPQAVP